MLETARRFHRSGQTDNSQSSDARFELSNPLVSPVHGNVSNFPPTILISGTRELLLSDTVMMHRVLSQAGVQADLHVYEGQSHGDYMRGLVGPLPESRDAQAEIRRFFDEHLE